MLKPKTFLLPVFLLLAIGWLYSSGLLKQNGSIKYLALRENNFRESLKKVKSQAVLARSFIHREGYNDKICFMIDMSRPSGSNRFFVYNLKTDTLQNSGLVTHGRCNQEWLEGRKYGNTVGCGCSSLGKYRIGKAYNGKFGLAFKLHGLEKTNDKAYERFVVLHSHSCVPETEIDSEICQSDGCPTVAPGFLQQLRPIIERSERPVLLWIFN